MLLCLYQITVAGESISQKIWQISPSLHPSHFCLLLLCCTILRFKPVEVRFFNVTDYTFPKKFNDQA